MSSNNFRLYPYFTPPPPMTTEDDAPSIQIDGVDPEPTTSEYCQPLDYTQLSQQDHLYAYRSGASDSGSECYSPSSPSSSSSSSPYITQSPAPSFSNYNADADQLSLQYHSKDPSLGFYTGQQPSDLSVSGLSISNFSDTVAGPSSPQQRHPIYSHPYMGFPRQSMSMPDSLNMTSETPLDTLGMLPLGLRRIASTSAASLYQPNPRHDTVDDPEFLYPEYVPDDQGVVPPLPTESHDSAIVALIQDLVDQESVDGEHVDYDIHELLDTHHIPTIDHHSRFLKAPKSTVASDAGRKASEKRRRHASKFRCMIRGCPSSFTRKLGLRNHLKSHFGIADQLCQHCKAMLPNSLARHEKRCKKNPKREPPSKKTQENPSTPM